MPERYERIRDSYVKRGRSLKTAKRLAAMTENALRRREGKAPASFHRKKRKN